MLNRNDTTPGKELKTRIGRLQSYLRNNNIDGAVILQKTDLYYFSGTIQQSHLYVPAEGKPILMVRKSVQRALAESSLEQIVPMDSPRQIPGLLKESGHPVPTVLGMELDVVPANIYMDFQKIFGSSKICDISHYIRLIRAIKSAYEIDLMQQAALFSDQVAASVTTIAYDGMTEIELAGKVEAVARSLGHQGIVRMRLWENEIFYGHLMSGSSAAVPSYLASPTGGNGVCPAIAQGPGFKRIKSNEPILVDYVFVHKGYLSDHTRIFALGGIPDDLIKAHETMLQIQDMLSDEAVPGTKSSRLFQLSFEHARRKGYEDNFMGFGERRIRFVGHGIGLELDEYPFLAEGQDMELQEGMTIALEPKLIFPGRGVVGIENTFRVTSKGLQKLSHYEERITVI